jgi:hypothetical protein
MGNWAVADDDREAVRSKPPPPTDTLRVRVLLAPPHRDRVQTICRRDTDRDRVDGSYRGPCPTATR